MSKNLLIIGAGGVAHAAAHKAAKQPKHFSSITIASRTLDKAEAIVKSIEQRGLSESTKLSYESVDAMDVGALKLLIERKEIDIVLNLGTPYVNMSVLRACIDTRTAYIDTAIHEDPVKICETPPWYANYEWKLKEECAEKGITAILGAGSDPGMVNVMARICTDEMDEGSVTDIDIIDINAGRYKDDIYFATNFNPEINFREFTGKVYFWEQNQWQQTEMFQRKRTDDLPVVGTQNSYLSGHDELHSLSQNLNVPNIRFWMGFGEHYINVFTVLKNTGLLSEQPVTLANGQQVVPLSVVAACLPDPATLADGYKGKTFIGVEARGTKHGTPATMMLYNICDHEETVAEVGSQAISYTAAIPAVATAMLIAAGDWKVDKMVNMEELNPAPYLPVMAEIGMPIQWAIDGQEMGVK